MGIEKLFNDSLKGESGELLRTINSLGRNLKEKEIKKALAGQDLHLTLDLKLQKLAEKHFPETKKGAFILMDSFSGALKVIVSRPSFNPNIFLDSIISNDWKKIQETQPFINRAFDSCYPPASIFKLITVSAALEEKIITQDSTWNCKGFFRFGKSNLRCRAKHGSLTTELAVAHSCNILFYEIGKRMNIDTLAHYAHTFGLGKKTNILFSEKKGLIPTYNWKIEYKGERWWKGETLSVAIGQSFLLTTPIQIARMVASIASGSLVNPRILEKETIIKQPLKISEKTRAFLNQSMRTASTEGTGKRLNNIENLTIFAKTGSAQTSELSKRKLGDKYLEHGWFVANIFYKNEKPITLVVIVENAGGSRIPVNITKKFLIEYSKLMQDEERKNS
ncbi:hypothetical protein HN446_01460 [bacterium]|nr:hypothetical protein [bacterium]